MKTIPFEKILQLIETKEPANIELALNIAKWHHSEIFELHFGCFAQDYEIWYKNEQAFQFYLEKKNFLVRLVEDKHKEPFKNRGVNLDKRQLHSLFYLASSLGKSFAQLTQAILDAMTGEMERLKEFGVKSEKEGDKIRFDFMGVKTEVTNTEKGIKEYVLFLGELFYQFKLNL